VIPSTVASRVYAGKLDSRPLHLIANSTNKFLIRGGEGRGGEGRGGEGERERERGEKGDRPKEHTLLTSILVGADSESKGVKKSNMGTAPWG